MGVLVPQYPTVLLSSCVPLRNSLSLPKPQFPHLPDGNDNHSFKGFRIRHKGEETMRKLCKVETRIWPRYYIFQQNLKNSFIAKVT